MDINLINKDIINKIDYTCKKDIFDNIYEYTITFIKNNIKISLIILFFTIYVIIINYDDDKKLHDTLNEKIKHNNK